MFSSRFLITTDLRSQYVRVFPPNRPLFYELPDILVETQLKLGFYLDFLNFLYVHTANNGHQQIWNILAKKGMPLLLLLLILAKLFQAISLLLMEKHFIVGWQVLQLSTCTF